MMITRSLIGSIALLGLVYWVIWTEGQSAFTACRSARCIGIELMIGNRESGFLQLVLTSLVATVLVAVVIENIRQVVERRNGETSI